jgi:hypothetical protein
VVKASSGRRSFFTRMEVARLFEVAPNTVTRWAREGKLECQRTPGGRRRYPRASTLELMCRLCGGVEPDARWAEGEGTDPYPNDELRGGES